MVSASPSAGVRSRAYTGFASLPCHGGGSFPPKQRTKRGPDMPERKPVCTWAPGPARRFDVNAGLFSTPSRQSLSASSQPAGQSGVPLPPSVSRTQSRKRKTKTRRHVPVSRAGLPHCKPGTALSRPHAFDGHDRSAAAAPLKPWRSSSVCAEQQCNHSLTGFWGGDKII